MCFLLLGWWAQVVIITNEVTPGTECHLASLQLLLVYLISVVSIPIHTYTSPSHAPPLSTAVQNCDLTYVWLFTLQLPMRQGKAIIVHRPGLHVSSPKMKMKWQMDWFLYNLFLVPMISQTLYRHKSSFTPFAPIHTMMAEAPCRLPVCLISSFNHSHNLPKVADKGSIFAKENSTWRLKACGL